MTTEELGVGMDDMKEIIDDFLVETDELIGSLDNNLVELETEPGNIDLLNEIFRAAHTIKGTSSFLGLDQVTTLTHRMEDVLNRLRKGEMAVDAVIMDTLLQSLDLLKQLIEFVREESPEQLDLTEILARLEGLLNESHEKAVAQALPGEEASDSEADLAVAGDGEVPVEGDEVPVDDTPDAAAAPTETTVAKATASADKSAAKKAADQTIRVDVDRLDTLMNMMGELVLGRNSLVQSTGRLLAEHEGDYNLESLNQATNAVSFITTELQMAVMKMRMQPVGKVFKKFHRMVRDLAREAKKQIDLEVSGEATELDKSVIEEIGDPLVHLIRNSCDHGIELPEERTAKGKSPRGLVRLDAKQEGSNIVISISDDGKGLDVEAIRAKAVERGLVSASAAAQLSRQEVFRFIFEAGLSTAKKITGVSGRGVGMDVVRTNIEKLSGLIELDSERDQGTTITIKLPLTLAIIQGLLVQSDDEVYILPLSSVHETVKTDESNVYYINQRPVLRLREDIIPIINLNEILKASPSGFIMAEKPYVVIVGLAEKKLGIIIDRFLGQEEVVIKSLGTYLGNTEGIAGATILGDGRIRLIVDLVGLFNIAQRIS